MITLKKTYTTFFFLGLFFIPFNEFEGLSFLGEYKNESATYFFLLGFLFAIADSFFKKKINFPYKHPLIVILGIFIFWTFLTIVFNYHTVSENFFKQTTGINRYLRQTISLLISAICFTFLFWNVLKNYTLREGFYKIRKVLFLGFVFVSVYGFFEIGILFFKLSFLRPIWDLFEYFPFVNNKLEVGDGTRHGISSVSYEIPALGNYLIFVFPWVLSYIFTEKSWLKFVPSIIAVVLMLFSDARAAFIVMIIQLFCFIIMLLHDNRYRKITVFGLQVTVIIIGVLAFLNSERIYQSIDKKLDRVSFYKNLNKNNSNKSRFGIQYAALQVFKEKPFCGVGFGQAAYQMRYHYPYWATNNNWEFSYKYQNQENKSFPTIYNMYVRLLAETGIIGVLLFLSLIALCLYYPLMYWKKTNFNDKYIGVLLLLSFIGFAMNWLQTDFFRQYGFWLMLIFLLKISNELNQQKLRPTKNYGE